MNYNYLLNKIRSGKINNIYIFLGEEVYLKNIVIEEIKKKLLKTEFAVDFNFTHFYGSDISFSKILTIANTLPVFNDWRIVVIDEFLKVKEINKLNYYIKDYSPQTCLILNEVENKIPSKYKFNLLNAVVYTFYPLNENELKAWIIQRVLSYKKNIAYEAVLKLMEYCDNSLLELVNEIEKLVLYIKDRPEITVDDIELVVGDRKAFNIFSLTDAILERNFSASLKIFSRLISEGMDLMRIFYMLNTTFHNLWLIKYLKKERNNDTMIMKKIGIKNFFRYKKIAKNIESFELSKLSKSIELFYTYDKMLKSYTGINKKNLVEKLIINLIIDK